MARDLTAALHALTIEAQGQTTRQDKALPEAPPATPIQARTGGSGPVRSTGGDGRSFSLGGARTLESSDGLFSFHFPATLTFVDSGVTYTLGLIEKTP
mgnify:CR=1 FL=1